MMVIRELLSCVASGVSSIIPKSSTIWVFGAWDGKLFSDNSKYLYKYMLNSHPEIHAVWIAKDRDLVRKMHKEGYCSYYYHSLKGVLLSVRAGAVFFTNGLGADVDAWAHSRCQRVCLWHGSPLKKIGYDNSNWKKIGQAGNKRRPTKRRFQVRENRDQDIYIVSSDEVKEKFKTAFMIKENQIYVAGQPRNDSFVRATESQFINGLKSTHPDAKIVCYLPTHRNFGTTKNNPLTPDILLETDKYLREKNIVLILKPHTHEMDNFRSIMGKFANIFLAVDESVFSDVYSFLPHCDCLISDYSSVYLDFLCTNKPVVLFPYDMDDYMKNDAGLYYEYPDIVPGHMGMTWKEVLELVCIELDKDSVSDQYMRIRDKFNKYNDGRNCERVYSLVKKRLEGAN